MTPAEKVNILLVDDQPGKLLAYEAILGELNENLITASSGKEALEYLLRKEIPIVLMDVSMPELDGFELAAMIRQHPRYQKTAIIFVSAVHLTELDKLRGYESGAVDYVSVPVVPELLRAKVRVFAELYRKTREAERLNEELERRVTERTAALAEAVAIQTDLADRLREADRRKDEFLALLAHELRNPLAPVRNVAGVLRMKGSDDPQLLWCHEVIERQAQHLTRLVDDLLDVARITSGRIALRQEPADLGTIVTAAVEASRSLIDSLHHRLLVTLPDAAVTITCDPARLTQVIANLLNNAAKYQDEHGEIALAVTRDEDSVTISVSDRGVGMSRDVLPHVFERFYQAERDADHSQGGLGVGLSLVKQLVELHGGTVSAESAGPGSGSTFRVQLACTPAPAVVSGRQAVVDKTNGVPPGPNRRVLVVDDSRDAAESLAMLLRMTGHEVSVAHDGPSALALAEQEHPGVLVLDIGLPGMDGYEICRRMRGLGLDDLRIIALTGYGQDRDRARAREAGFDRHVVKPVDYADIVRFVGE